MMKIKLLAFGAFFSFAIQAAAQINPVSNLTWTHQYLMPHNFFGLNWDQPASPHDELIGYNVYRESEFYRSQTENFLAHMVFNSNCDEDFMFYGDGSGFFAHITAVYANGIESDFTETIFINPPALNTADFEKPRAIVYPNPTSGILNIGNQDLSKIEVYDISGKKLLEFDRQAQIDLSGISKGVYLIKLISDNGASVSKIAIE